jgi:hypothetical protein
MSSIEYITDQPTDQTVNSTNKPNATNHATDRSQRVECRCASCLQRNPQGQAGRGVLMRAPDFARHSASGAGAAVGDWKAAIRVCLDFLDVVGRVLTDDSDMLLCAMPLMFCQALASAYLSAFNPKYPDKHPGQGHRSAHRRMARGPRRVPGRAGPHGGSGRAAPHVAAPAADAAGGHRHLAHAACHARCGRSCTGSRRCRSSGSTASCHVGPGSRAGGITSFPAASARPQSRFGRP